MARSPKIVSGLFSDRHTLRTRRTKECAWEEVVKATQLKSDAKTLLKLHNCAAALACMGCERKREEM